MQTDTVTIVEKSLSENEISELETIELLFFAYRDFIADADRVLEKLAFGRAHHRVLYFVNRKPGLMVAELLDLLGITKQSLARVLKQLINSGYIVQMTGASDRRQRLLYPTQNGRELILRLSLPQSRRIENALTSVGKTSDSSIKRFLRQMTDSADTSK
ncbi:MAG: MarR family transcriptional regulator [Salaquimonas sp.]